MEMELDASPESDTDNFICRPKSKPTNRNIALHFDLVLPDTGTDRNSIECPSTPKNRMSEDASGFCSTPLLSMGSANASYQNTYGVDRNMNKSNISLSSTPMVPFRPSHSISLPNPFQRMHSADSRQCKSHENLVLYRIGSEELPLEYMNPFTPDGKLLLNKANAQKQLRRLSINPVKKLDLGDDLGSDGQGFEGDDIEVPERRRLSEFNVSRFREEFVQIKQIGKGHHGFVYKCVNRMNGCLYAIKRTVNEIKSGIQEKIIRNEIYAHGILDHPNIIRNYSCWKEEGYVYIQNEYCNGGNLEDYVSLNTMNEASLYNLLLQMAHALRYLHHKGLVHMDIKPENILLSIDNTIENTKENIPISDGDFSNKDNEATIIFKLGDLGHITRLDEDKDVEEGDCRFLPKEILQMKYEHLDRADIFALGLTVFFAAGGGPLPKNGEPWQEIRQGNIKYLENHSKEFNNLLKSMVDVSPEKRPSAVELIGMVNTNPPSASYGSTGFEQRLRQKYQLNTCVLKQKCESEEQCSSVPAESQRQLQDQQKDLQKSPSKDTSVNAVKKRGPLSKSRTVGKKTKRSSSTTLF